MPEAMAMDLDEGLRQSNARFMASINRILERYNQPFEDDILISIETLTYNTCKGPKRWEEVSVEKLRKWKKEVLERTRGSQSNAGKVFEKNLSKKQTSDFEDGHSTTNQESPENSCMDTSDIVVGEESDADIASVRRYCRVSDNSEYKLLQKARVSLVKNSYRLLPDFHIENHHIDDKKIQEKVKVQVDAIVQDSARKIPEWITIARQGSPKALHLASPVQELIGNQAAVCRKKVESSNECSSSRPLQLKFCDVPISPKRISVPRHQCSPRLDKTCFILEEYQSADEECSWGDVTLADLYPSMVETFTRLMTKDCRRKTLKYMFGHFRHKRWRPRRLKLNVTVDKIRGFRPLKLKKALPSICSSRSEDIWNQTFGNESGELCDDNCAINNLSGQVPYSYINKNEVKMNYSDSSLQHHFISGRGQKFSKHTAFPHVMATMGETFLVEDELQPAVSLKNSKCKESEKLTYKCSSEYRFRTSTASSGSAVLHLIKDSKTQKTAFPCGDTSELCSSACSSYGNSNTFALATNCSPLRPSDTLIPTPEKIISERRISFQCTHSFSSLSTKQSPSKIPQKYEDAFEKLYYKLCSKEIQTPLTRPLSNSQNLEKKGSLVKTDLSGSVMFNTQYDIEFNKIYKQLCSEAVPELPGIQRASHLRKYEGVQLSETVNALVNSPVRTLSAIPRVKRVGNFQNDLLCSPVKRLKNIPERYFTSPKCQQIPHRKNVNLQTVGMDCLSTCNGSNPSFFGSRNCQSQDSGFHASSDKAFLDIPSTSLQESGIADAHSGLPRAMKNHSHPDNAQKYNKRISRKLSYTDGKDQKS